MKTLLIIISAGLFSISTFASDYIEATVKVNGEVFGNASSPSHNGYLKIGDQIEITAEASSHLRGNKNLRFKFKINYGDKTIETDLSSSGVLKFPIQEAVAKKGFIKVSVTEFVHDDSGSTRFLRFYVQHPKKQSKINQVSVFIDGKQVETVNAPVELESGSQLNNSPLLEVKVGQTIKIVTHVDYAPEDETVGYRFSAWGYSRASANTYRTTEVAKTDLLDDNFIEFTVTEDMINYIPDLFETHLRGINVKAQISNSDEVFGKKDLSHGKNKVEIDDFLEITFLVINNNETPSGPVILESLE